MKSVSNMLDYVRNIVRSIMNKVAIFLNKISKGKLSPNSITITSLLAHVPIAFCIAWQKNVHAAILLLIFGLFDALDGALARAQKRDSSSGMLLDASTDRMKEVFLYTGILYALIDTNKAYWGIWALAACGGSLLVSYVKAKGETAVSGSLKPNEINRLFQDGLMRFEIRMATLIIGLLIDRLDIAVLAIAILSWYTAIIRLVGITRKLRNVQC